MLSKKTKKLRLKNGTAYSERNFGPNSLKIYYVTQSFGDPQVEKDMIPMLKDLLQKTGCEIICIEGGTGDVSLNHISKGATKSRRKEVAMKYVEDGQLSAVEYLSYVAEERFRLLGVDDKDSREKIQQIGAKTYGKRETWDDLFGISDSESGKVISATISVLKRSLGMGSDLPPKNTLRGDLLRYGTKSKSLIQFLGKENLFDIEDILRHAEKLGLELNFGMKMIKRTKELEGGINFNRANKEAQSIPLELAKFLGDPEEILRGSLEKSVPEYETATPETLMSDFNHPTSLMTAELNSKIKTTPLFKLLNEYVQADEQRPEILQMKVAPLDLYKAAFNELKRETDEMFDDYRQNETVGVASSPELEAIMSGSVSGEMFQHLLDLIVLFGLKIESYPNLIKYVQYYEHMRRVNIVDTVTEIESLKDKIAQELCENDDDREFVKLHKQLGCLRRLLTFAMLSGEYKKFNRELKTLNHQTLLESLNRFIPNSRAVRKFAEIKDEFEENLRDCSDWYKFHSRRANKMTENTLQRMEENKITTAILITGGFHKDGIIARFEQTRVSYTVIIPLIKQQPTQQLLGDYFTKLLNETSGGKTND